MSENIPTKDDWAAKHAEYKESEWIDRPSLFAEMALEYFPASGRILELGAGQGQDSRFFAENGYNVVSTDQSAAALATNREKLPTELVQKVTIEAVDISQKLPYPDASFAVVYAHLSLHYFDEATTRQIFAEIRRVLVPGGLLVFLVNSTGDSEYNMGRKIEHDFFEVDDKEKRFFSIESAKEFVTDFTPKLIDNQGETYKDREKGIHNLIRFIGVK